MRILLVHNNYLIKGGGEVFYHEIGRTLKANGHSVAYFSCQEDGLDVSNVDDFPSAVEYNKGNILQKLCRLPMAIYNHNSREAMAQKIASFKPDLIHVFSVHVRLTPSVLDAARDASIPVVMSCNDYAHICPNYKLYHHGRICYECKGNKYYRALINRCCHDSFAYSAAGALEAYIHNWLNIWKKNISCFLFASKFVAKKTVEFWGKGSVKIDYLRNPFDLDKYYVKQNVGRYILYFGRLVEEKGVDILLKAAKLASQVQIIIVGDGPDRKKLEFYARYIKNVRFVGPAWGEELSQWLYDARVVVVPSLWHENFPYVILQAFAASKPVIGANRGGIPELLCAGSHGWLYDAEDEKSLARVISEVFLLPDSIISEMGARAYQYVAHEFTDEVIYRRLHSIYKGVLV